jgi:uncharacterized coiled-coil protein SlyX
MHPMSNMLTVNYRKLQKNGNEEKIEMSNMLIEKERKKERKKEDMRILRQKLRLLQRRDNAAYELSAHSILKFISVRCNEERMQPMSNALIVIIFIFPFATTKR